MKNKDKIQKMVVLAILFALAIVLQAIATFIPSVAVYALPLGLIPVAVAAVIYGPGYGALIGALWGAYINIFDGSCQNFYNWLPDDPARSVFFTILAVTGRGALDGFFVGIVYKYLYKLIRHIIKLIKKDKDNETKEILVETITTGISSVLLCIFNVFVFYSAVGLMFTNKWVTVSQFFTVNLAIIVVVSVISTPVISRVVIAANRILNTSKTYEHKEIDDETTSNTFDELNK